MNETTFLNLSTGEVETVGEGHTLHTFATRQSRSAESLPIDIRALFTNYNEPIIVFDNVINTYAYCSLAEFVAVCMEWITDAEDDEERKERIETAEDASIYQWDASWGENECTNCGKEISSKEKK